MAKPILDDELWELIRPLLPPPKPRRFRFPGRKRQDDRASLTGIIFVLKTGIPWEQLPQEMGCGSGMTCWRRLAEWQSAGVWEKLHKLLLDKLQGADRLDWSRAVIDSSTVRAVGAGEKNRPEPYGSVPAWEQAPHRHRRQRRPAGGHADRSQPARRHTAPAAR